MSTVLFASHTPESSVFHVGSHHLAREVARAGHRVGHISTPLSPVKLLGAGNRNGLRERWVDYLRGPRSRAERQFSATPFTLLPVQKFALAGHSLALRSAVPSLPSTIARMGLLPLDHLVIDQPLFAGLPELLRARTVVYRPTDVYQSPAMRRAEEQLLHLVDGVVATSATVLDELPRRACDLPKLVLPNGVETAHFDARPSRGPADSDTSAPGARDARGGAVVYVGALDERIDWEWLAALARELEGTSLDLIGPAASVPEGLPTNVQLLGSIDYTQLPQVLARYRVAMLPFTASLENRGRSPMKLYEYLAAGLFVVGTGHMAGTDEQLPGVSHHPSPGAAATDVRAALRSTHGNELGRSAAASQDWAVKAQTLLQFLGGL